MWKTSLLLCAALIGCHSSMDDMSSMRSYIDETRAETHRHRDAVRAATTMPHVHDEMAVHRNGMLPVMADMSSTMRSMNMHCDGLGLDEMRAMHGELEGEMTRHLSTMEARTELAMAQTEVERHAGTMLAVMDGMRGAMGSMHCR
jgi:hypothetical protein